MKYGIFDTIDNCWIGSLNGPNVYTEIERNGNKISAFDMARMAKTVLIQMMVGKNKKRRERIKMASKKVGALPIDLISRFQIREINDKEQFRYKDSVTGKIDCVTAIKELERGSINY